MTLIGRKKVHVRDLDVNGFRVRAAVRKGDRNKFIPLLIFNGIGANWELLQPFIDFLDPDQDVIMFDIPGVGSSETPILPYRPSQMALLARGIVQKLGYFEVAALGISWGGGLAQEFAYRCPVVCKKVILMATSAGMVMKPGKPSVLFKMVTPLRYWSPTYMKRNAAHLYGGELRRNPDIIDGVIKNLRINSPWGYFLQLFALYGWTSFFWLSKLKQEAIVFAGDDDPIVPLLNGKILANKIPNARLEVIEGGGHLFFILQEEKVIPILTEFLKQTEDLELE